MRSLAALALLLSVPTYACPMLAGTYTCTYADGEAETVTITQSALESGAVNYIYNGSEINADNHVYRVPDDQSLQQGTFHAWCDGLELKTELVGKYWDGGAFYGDLTLDVTYTLDGDGNLKTTTLGQLETVAATQPIQTIMTCSRD